MIAEGQETRPQRRIDTPDTPPPISPQNKLCSEPREVQFTAGSQMSALVQGDFDFLYVPGRINMGMKFRQHQVVELRY